MSTSIVFGAAATSLDTLVVCAAYAYLLESQQYRRRQSSWLNTLVSEYATRSICHDDTL